VTDRVDAAVNRVKAAGGDPAGDPAGMEPERDELGPRDDAVLTRRQRRDAHVDRRWVSSTTSVVLDLTRTAGGRGSARWWVNWRTSAVVVLTHLAHHAS